MSTFYGCNDEEFYDSSWEEAAISLWENGDAEIGDEATVYSMEFVKCKASDFLPSMAEDLVERAYDELGESPNDWSFGAEEDKALQGAVGDFVNYWCHANNCEPPLHRGVGKSEKIRVRFTDEFGESEIITEGGEA